jgi:hypothetical protein
MKETTEIWKSWKRKSETSSKKTLALRAYDVPPLIIFKGKKLILSL